MGTWHEQGMQAKTRIYILGVNTREWESSCCSSPVSHSSLVCSEPPPYRYDRNQHTPKEGSGHCCISPVSDHRQFAPVRKDNTMSTSGLIHLYYVVKWVQYLMHNITSHDSFFFYTILQIHYVNTKLKLYTLICNFNQLIITFIKCVVSKALTAYIIAILKGSINSQYLLFLSAVMILDGIKCHVRDKLFIPFSI